MAAAASLVAPTTATGSGGSGSGSGSGSGGGSGAATPSFRRRVGSFFRRHPSTPLTRSGDEPSAGDDGITPPVERGTGQHSAPVTPSAPIVPGNPPPVSILGTPMKATPAVSADLAPSRLFSQPPSQLPSKPASTPSSMDRVLPGGAVPQPAANHAAGRAAPVLPSGVCSRRSHRRRRPP
ncbi:hypothetical protein CAUPRSCDRAFT_12848 [Caulochytrium protostelioides]|uniref:Uncharacterized protein n=1 Tax=Caulochytrium protostelioides TaxID=1555241 RepID=A0A4P9WTB3_9FUNG|nr:hypothetical protein CAUPRSCDRAFT_12848 [Caulochytrium protostelioides]